MPPEVVDAVIARSGGMCEVQTPRCRGLSLAKEAGEALHHRKLRKQGGPHTVDNILHICHQAHIYIHNNPTESYENGWLIKSWDEITPYRGPTDD
jgi:hypothetical protein